MRQWLWSLVLACGLLACGGAQVEDPELLTVALDVGPASLDPRLGSDEASRRVQQLLYNALVRFDERGAPVGDLAVGWENPDPLRYVFHLRTGVQFHDGRPFTSEDVRYTFESVIENEVPSFRKADFEKIDSIETPDPHTVVFHLREPFSPFVSNLTVGILPNHAGPEAAEDPVGTGPFEFLQYRRDRDLNFKANSSYHEGVPPCAKLRLKIVPNATSRQQELLKGTVDLVLNDLTPDQVKTLEGRPGLKIATSPSTSYSYLGFNLEDPILSNIRVRQAIAHALDRDQLIEVLLHGLARPSTGLLPPDHWAYEEEVALYPYDPVRAQALLDEAGYPDPDGSGPGERFRITYKTTTAELARNQAAVFQEQLGKVGIALDIRSFEWGTFYEDVKAGRFQMFSLQWTQILDPDVYRMRFGSDYLPPNGFNRIRYRNDEVDRLLEEGARSQGAESRLQIYSRVQKVLAEELPYVSLWHKSNVAVMRERLSGFTLTPAADFSVLSKVAVH